MSKSVQWTKPNILFLLSDQQRFDTLSCCGSPIVEGLTPNLDQMASQGVRFEFAFTPQPVCGPARACIQTSRYATETGCFRNGIALPSDAKTIAHIMSQAGYEVGYIGKWHLASTQDLPGERNADFRQKPVPIERRGGYKDYWLASDVLEFTSHPYGGHMFNIHNRKRQYPKERYRADAETDWVLEYLRTRQHNRPFYLMVSYVEPHQQNDIEHIVGPRGSQKRFEEYHVPGDLTEGTGDWEQEMPDYLGCCKSLDDNVGRILDELIRQGLEENTLVLYASDHGCHFRTQEGEYKRSCHDSSIRIPMILKGPGFQGGRIFREFVSLLDIAPTVLTAGGIKLPNTYRGRALQDLVSQKSQEWRTDVFVQISESQVGRSIRTRQWTYSIRAWDKDSRVDSCSDEYHEEYLFDNEHDPGQKNNLAAHPDYKDIRFQLAERLKQRMAEAGENRPIIHPIKSGMRSSQ